MPLSMRKFSRLRKFGLAKTEKISMITAILQKLATISISTITHKRKIKKFHPLQEVRFIEL